jgi:hypothetical protein
MLPSSEVPAVVLAQAGKGESHRGKGIQARCGDHEVWQPQMFACLKGPL